MRQKIISLSKNTFIQGGFFLTISGFIANFFNYLFNILIGRSLGPKGYGEIVSLFSYILIASIPLTIITTIIIQKISSRDENKYVYVQSLENWFFFKLKIYFLLFTPLFVAIPFLPRLTNLTLLSSISLVIMIALSIIGSFYSSALQGLHLFFAIACITILSAFLKLIGAMLVFFGIDGLTTIIILLIISSIIGFFLTLFIYKKNIQEHKTLTIPSIDKRLKNILIDKQTLLTTLSVLAFTCLSNIDILIVKKYFSGFDAGIYSSWSLFAKIILYIIGPIISLSLIFFSSKKNVENQNKVLFISFVILITIGVISFLSYHIFPRFITNFFFGQKFNNVIPYLPYAAIFGTFYTAILLMNNYFLAKKSKGTLVLPLFVPFYIISLFLFKSSIQNIITVNIIFSIIITFSYLIFYLSTNSVIARNE